MKLKYKICSGRKTLIRYGLCDNNCEKCVYNINLTSVRKLLILIQSFKISLEFYHVMLDYNIRFTEQDISRVLQDWQRQAKESSDAVAWQHALIAHQLMSSSEGPFQLHELVNVRHENSYFKKLVLEDVVQRAFVHNIASLGLLYIHACRDAVLGTTEGKDDLKGLAKNYYEAIRDLAAYMPITPLVSKLGPLNDSSSD